VLNLASEATFDGDEAETTPGRPSQRKGVELSASYKPLPWLRLDSNFAATHVRYANGDPGTSDTEPGHPGSYIPNSPDLISTATVTVEDLGPWFGALKFRYFGRRPLIEDDSVTSKPTTLVDLRIGYKFSEQARLCTALASIAAGLASSAVVISLLSERGRRCRPITAGLL
jgi:outer membrane receptor protein involved in Fe transport